MPENKRLEFEFTLGMLLPIAVQIWLSRKSASQNDCDLVTQVILDRHLSRGGANQIYQLLIEQTYKNDIKKTHTGYNPDLVRKSDLELYGDNIDDFLIDEFNILEKENGLNEESSASEAKIRMKQVAELRVLLLRWCIFGRRATGLYQLYKAFYQGTGLKGDFCSDWCNMVQSNFTQWEDHLGLLNSEISALDDLTLIDAGEWFKLLAETPESMSDSDSINVFNQDEMTNNGSSSHALAEELQRLYLHITKLGIQKTSDAYNEFTFITQPKEDSSIQDENSQKPVDTLDKRKQQLIEWYEFLPADHPKKEKHTDLRQFISGIFQGEYCHPPDHTEADHQIDEEAAGQAWSEAERNQFLKSLKVNFPQHYKCYLHLASMMSLSYQFLDCFPFFDQSVDLTELLNDEFFPMRKQKIINRLEYWRGVAYRIHGSMAQPFDEWEMRLDIGHLTLEDVEASLDALDEDELSEQPEVLKRAIYSTLLDELQRLMVTWFQFKREKMEWAMYDVREEIRKKELKFVRAN